MLHRPTLPRNSSVCLSSLLSHLSGFRDGQWKEEGIGISAMADSLDPRPIIAAHGPAETARETKHADVSLAVKKLNRSRCRMGKYGAVVVEKRHDALPARQARGPLR